MGTNGGSAGQNKIIYSRPHGSFSVEPADWLVIEARGLLGILAKSPFNSLTLAETYLIME
ncbi:hypothetical protein D7X48_17050 [bacterium D16-50]|nr:hypothetical protein D7X48_17050 [bacterium D16-50]